MTLRKIAALGLAASTLALVGTSIAGAADNDAKGPACVDIIGPGSGGTYLASGLVTINVKLGAPQCKQFDYSIVLQTAEGTQSLQQAGTNAEGDVVFFQGMVNTTTNSSVCVSGKVSIGNENHIFDTAPDSGCISLGLSSGGGFTEFG